MAFTEIVLLACAYSKVLNDTKKVRVRTYATLRHCNLQHENPERLDTIDSGSIYMQWYRLIAYTFLCSQLNFIATLRSGLAKMSN